MLTVHIEPAADPRPLLDSIRELGLPAGLSLNPPTALSTIEPFLDHCDLVLVMSVMAGFGGQAFDPVALEKLKRLRELKPELLLSVDGGINRETAQLVARAGADLMVAGSALFTEANYGRFIDEMADLARSARTEGQAT